MALITRLDGRSSDNDKLCIVDEEGEVIAEIKCVSPKAELSITTKSGLHIEKPNGFSSKR